MKFGQQGQEKTILSFPTSVSSTMMPSGVVQVAGYSNGEIAFYSFSFLISQFLCPQAVCTLGLMSLDIKACILGPVSRKGWLISGNSLVLSQAQVRHCHWNLSQRQYEQVASNTYLGILTYGFEFSDD